VSTKNLNCACLAVLLGAAITVFVCESRSARADQEKLDALARKRIDAHAEIGRLRRAIAEGDRVESRLREELKGAQAMDAAARGASESRVLRVRQVITAWTNLRYGRLFAKLGLIADQILKFDELVLNHQLALRDIAEASKANGVSGADPAIVQLRSQDSEQFQAQEAALLGEDGYKQFQEDSRTSQPRDWVNGLAGNLYATEPLSAQQEDGLVQILANMNPEYQSGGNANTGQIRDWDTVFNQAQGVLSPAQLEAMKTMQATFQAGLEAVKEAVALQDQGSSSPALGSSSPVPK
jgi:hypothetical protein